MVKESVLELIGKLLALSHSPNENEASVAMGKAQELLIKYNLDMESVKANNPAAPVSNESMLINEIVDFDKYSTWQWTLLNIIAINSFCKTIRGDGSIHILGRKANVRTVVAMYNWLEPQITRMAANSQYKRADKVAYIEGMILTINKRLKEQMEVHQSNVTTRDIITNVQAEINNWFRSQYPHVSHTRSSNSGSRDAYSRGAADGGGISINGSSRQITGRLMLQ